MPVDYTFFKVYPLPGGRPRGRPWGGPLGRPSSVRGLLLPSPPGSSLPLGSGCRSRLPGCYSFVPLLCLGLPGEPLQPLRASEVPGMMPLATIGSLNLGGFIPMVPVKASPRRVSPTTYTTAFLVFTPGAEMSPTLAPVAPHWIRNIGPDIKSFPYSQIH